MKMNIDEINKQIEGIEKNPDLQIAFENAQKVIDSLGGSLVVKRGDDIATVCYYITMLATRQILSAEKS